MPYFKLITVNQQRFYKSMMRRAFFQHLLYLRFPLPCEKRAKWRFTRKCISIFKFTYGSLGIYESTKQMVNAYLPKNIRSPARYDFLFLMFTKFK